MIRILNGNSEQLIRELGELAAGLEFRIGDVVVQDDVVCRAVFERMITHGYVPMTTAKGTGQKVDFYDPEVEIVFVRPLAGG